MKPRAGIVGPSDFVQLICDIATEYSNRIETISVTYENMDEVTRILQQYEHQTDLWIFAGPGLYNAAQRSGSNKPVFFLELDGASLTKTLVEIGYKDGKSLERVSIDMLTKRDVTETYHDLGVPNNEVYVKEYLHDTPHAELLTFHQRLFNNGTVNLCVTCLYSVYEKLRSQGIPTYRVTPTRSNIRETLTKAIQQWETLHFKQSQITTFLIQIQKMEQKSDFHSISYDLHRLNLELQAAMLNFSESISGSFMNLGVGTFMIFSTRGSLHNSKQQISSFLEELALITDLPANIGIGFGDSALAAEENARLALNHAQNYGPFSAFLVDTNGTIEGPLKEEENITYSYRTENKEISDRLKDSGITITTFNKILSVQKRIGTNSVTAANIADWLKMTPRNARRILNGLVKQGIAEIIGEEAPTSKGRPRKIYYINDK